MAANTKRYKQNSSFGSVFVVDISASFSKDKMPAFFNIDSILYSQF